MPVLDDRAVADPEDVDLADRVGLPLGGRPMKGPTWTACEVTRAATRSPSAIMSSIVIVASARPFETRSMASFIPSRPCMSGPPPCPDEVVAEELVHRVGGSREEDLLDHPPHERLVAARGSSPRRFPGPASSGSSSLTTHPRSSLGGRGKGGDATVRRGVAGASQVVAVSEPARPAPRGGRRAMGSSARTCSARVGRRNPATVRASWYGTRRWVARRRRSVSTRPSAEAVGGDPDHLGAEVLGVVEVLAQVPIAVERPALAGRRDHDDRQERRPGARSRAWRPGAGRSGGDRGVVDRRRRPDRPTGRRTRLSPPAPISPSSSSTCWATKRSGDLAQGREVRLGEEPIERDLGPFRRVDVAVAASAGAARAGSCRRARPRRRRPGPRRAGAR